MVEKNSIRISTYIEKIIKIFKKILLFFISPKKVSSRFLRAYLVTIIVGAALLYTPWSLSSYTKSNGNEYKIFDALFTSTSAFSDTGLVVTQTSKQFTLFGQIVIASLILLGGIGIMSVKIMLIRLFANKLKLKDIILLHDERGSTKIGDSHIVIVRATKIVLSFIAFGTIALAPYFYFIKQEFPIPTYQNLWKSFWYALFQSISAINNAGFDIIGAQSLRVYANDFYVQLIFIILIVVGGIGFPVINDIFRFCKHKLKKKESLFKWSLFTKLTVYTYFVIFIFGVVLSLSFEILSDNPYSLWNQAKAGTLIIDGVGKTSKIDVLNGIIFTNFSTRNAGFSTIPISMFSEPTKFIFSILMWIGSSPASTAGGVRTTTIAIIILTLYSAWTKKGSSRVMAYGKRIPQETIFRSMQVVLSSTTLILFAVSIIMINLQLKIPDLSVKREYGLINVFFEVTSAFGTTGLSTGITSNLPHISLFILIVLMIIGQIGFSAVFNIFGTSINESTTQNEPIYGEEDVLIS